VRVRGWIGGDDFTFVRAAVLAGGGIGLLPQIICADDESAGRLVRVLPDHESRGGAFHLIYPSAHHVPARVAVFRDFVVDWFDARRAKCEKAKAKAKNAT
jgi:DNA-binding transcriptional LysR family regulator